MVFFPSKYWEYTMCQAVKTNSLFPWIRHCRGKDRQKQVNKYKSKIISIVKVKEDYVIVTRWQREIDWWGENFFYKGHLSCYMNDKSPIWRFEQTAFQAEKRVSTKALGQPNFWLLATVGKKVRQDHVKGESTVTVSL